MLSIQGKISSVVTENFSYILQKIRFDNVEQFAWNVKLHFSEENTINLLSADLPRVLSNG